LEYSLFFLNKNNNVFRHKSL